MVFNQKFIIKDLVAICQAIDPDFFEDWLVARIDRMVIYCVRLIRGLTVELDDYEYLRFSRDKIALTKT